MDYWVKQLDTDIQIGDNELIAPDAEMENSSILFRGTGNILFLAPGVHLNDVVIKFLGNNSVVYISKSKYQCTFQVNMFHDSVFYMGENNSINGKKAVFQLSEYKNIFIGDDNMLSYGLTLRVADPHLIYSASTKERVNPSKSIYIGDHVWIGQNVNILKGVRIGSGSIIAGEALLTKTVPSNTTFGGNPAKKLKEGIFWMRPSVHAFTPAHTEKWQRHDGDEFIFTNQNTYSFTTIEKNLTQLANPQDKLAFLQNLPKDKNRFFADTDANKIQRKPKKAHFFNRGKK
ncbi:acyltransferase [Weissella kandleri]|uniref:acyltransferase n=1 Tax=Weissella kandleri TaxID=1616 RepID=UPI00387E7543